MGEEENKPEEKKVEEQKKPEEEPKKEEEAKKPEEEKKNEKKTEEPKESKEPSPPPEEIVLRVFMHCEGCSKKVRKSLRGFEGVEDVQTDCKTHIVIVKGKKADPLKVLERVQRKSHKKVELLSPIPKPPTEEEKKVAEKKEEPKPEEKKEEVVIIVVIKVHMHCEACAQEIRKRILRIKGVEDAIPDLKSSQVTVKGVFDPTKLVEYIYKRTGKQAVILKTEPEKKEEEKKEEKKGEEVKKEKKEGEGGEGEKKDKKEEAATAAAAAAAEKPAAGEEEGAKKVEVEVIKNEFNYYPTKYNMEYVYAPQIFSDENPNACSVM